MSELMNHVEFRTALENAIKGESANKAPFSIAWASGKLSRAHLASWAENHFHYVGPFADYLAYIYARMPERYTEAKDFLLANMYEEEIGGDRHTDLLIRFAEACGTTRERVIDPDNMTATTRGLQSWCYSVAMREDPIVAVAALVVGLTWLRMIYGQASASSVRTNLLRPATLSDPIRIDAIPVHVGRSVAVTRVTSLNPAGKPTTIATVTGIPLATDSTE